MCESTTIRVRAEISKRCKKEQRKMLKIFWDSGLDADKINILTPLIENISWMKVKLDDAREDIGEDGLTAKYDNGGGQKGIREHPAFKAYESLWKSYNSGLAVILSHMQGQDAEKAVETIQQSSEVPNALELVLSRRKDA